ncbi:cache domain-containing sensor histidine kinase [Paenibacillus terrigena]|uniref:cache domain-containing sensor histidine kinase n=1 Tax=Paenibacillus terrigena TaxID=369333 RepID=UPI000378BDB1|nr:sensor histidine kinase [Paenibacillus terrigena]
MKHFKRIQFIIAFSFILITVVTVLIVSFMLYNKFSNTAEDNADLNMGQVVEQVKYNLEMYVKNMTSIFDVVEETINRSPSYSSSILEEQLNSIMKTREDLISIAVFTKNGDLVVNIPKMEMRPYTLLQRQSWFNAALETPDQLSVSSPHIQNLFKTSYKWAVSLSKQTTYHRDGLASKGVLVVDMNFKTIDELSRQVVFGKRGYVYIIDSYGNIVYHPQQQLIHAGLKYEDLERVLTYSYGSYQDELNGEQRMITIKSVNPIGWKVIGVAYKDELLTTKSELNTFLLWFLIVVIIFVLLLAIFVSARISSPIQRLARSVKMMGEGHLNTPIPVSGIYEVEQLSRRYHVMLQQIRHLMDQIIVEQEAKRKSELDVLQAQINPHFLYNTLNSVIRLVEKGQSSEAVTAITSLSRFFRISLSKGKNFISVQEELEHIRHYLIIQTIRYKNKFHYTIEAEDEVLHFLTMKLILQPIVENAIVHGIELMADRGMIRISAKVDAGKLLFEIADNGLGMSRDALDQLLKNTPNSAQGSGVGVRNVNQRIQLHYGPDYGIQFESEIEEGTTVRIYLPVEIAQKEGEV